MAHTIPFEILISTMFRSDFTFLEAMFPKVSCWDYHILIINQTNNAHQLLSSHSNIRVINTHERGLPLSRNMAIKNAHGKICLIADDDVRYVENLLDIVISAFNKANDATIITFQMLDRHGDLYQKYRKIRVHNRKTLNTINGVVIAFNLSKLLESEISYDPLFGLGATFESANEYVFMRNALAANVRCVFEEQIILSHTDVSSGQRSSDNSIIYARAAVRFKYMGWLAYVSMIKYVWFYYRRKEICLNEISSKISIAFAGIKKYKQLR